MKFPLILKTIFNKEGEELKSVFLISDGSVKEYNSYYDKSHYFGDILGMP